MTCREKLKIEHPESVGDDFCGGCRGCPKDYGYLDDPEFCVNRTIRGFIESKCVKCWDREIPCSTDKFMSYENRETLKDILNELEFGDQHEVKSVRELLEENRELKKQLEEKDELISKLKACIRELEDEIY